MCAHPLPLLLKQTHAHARSLADVMHATHLTLGPDQEGLVRGEERLVERLPWVGVEVLVGDEVVVEVGLEIPRSLKSAVPIVHSKERLGIRLGGLQVERPRGR